MAENNNVTALHDYVACAPLGPELADALTMTKDSDGDGCDEWVGGTAERS